MILVMSANSQLSSFVLFKLFIGRQILFYRNIQLTQIRRNKLDFRLKFYITHIIYNNINIFVISIYIKL